MVQNISTIEYGTHHKRHFITQFPQIPLFGVFLKFVALLSYSKLNAVIFY